jgi:hypothetical protein
MIEGDENLLEEGYVEEENTINKKTPLIYGWGRNDDG